MSVPGQTTNGTRSKLTSLREGCKSYIHISQKLCWCITGLARSGSTHFSNRSRQNTKHAHASDVPGGSPRLRKPTACWTSTDRHSCVCVCEANTELDRLDCEPYRSLLGCHPVMAHTKTKKKNEREKEEHLGNKNMADKIQHFSQYIQNKTYRTEWKHYTGMPWVHSCTTTQIFSST